jgi:hypothetical protein
MTEAAQATTPEFTERLAHDGFVFVSGETMCTLLRQMSELDDWPAFTASWNELVVDSYLAQQGRFRRRRHATYAVSGNGTIVRTPHQAHYQRLEYNSLQGGIERWFEPIGEDVGVGESMRAILGFACEIFTSLAPLVLAWNVEVHQFRIEAGPGEPGQPTPEGSHRDGVDYVLVLLIERRNIASGTTRIQSPNGRALGEFTLAQPFDAALLVDERVYHVVTPVHALDPLQEAHRDVLVATFRAVA